MNRSSVVSTFVRTVLCLFFISQFHSTAEARSVLKCFEVFPVKEEVVTAEVHSLYETEKGPAQRSINYYLDLVTNRVNAMLTPRFIDPKVELGLPALWKGTREVPEAVKDVLLDEMAVIDFQLLAADKGVVKIGDPGSFTPFRLNHQWNGKDMSTNIGMDGGAMWARALEGGKYLVPSTTKAVFIFAHGGGTKTTGHHVAAALSNYMAQLGVTVVSMDSPYHAYGPRLLELNPVDYYKYLVDFRHKYFPADVPVFFGGHSMGGLHADNLMRLSDQSSLGISTAFKGLVNLSGPIDAAPGKSLAEKSAAEELIRSKPEIWDLVDPAERDLSVTLLMDGKTSALSGVSTETFGSVVPWIKPAHQGNAWLPTLVVMGERDALYIGREKLFDEYMKSLANTKVEILGQRMDYKGRERYIGHMIFDHYRNGSKEFEVFSLIREFMEGQLGQQFQSKSNYFLDSYNQSNSGVLAKVLQAYFNNLAFREFAAQYEHVGRSSTKVIQEMGARTAALSKTIRQIQADLKANKDADPIVIQTMKDRLAVAEAEMGVMRAKQTSTFIPADHRQASAEANVQRRADLQTELDRVLAYKKEMMKEITPLRDQLKKLQGLHARNIKEYGELESLKAEDVKVAEEAFERSLKIMIDLQVEMNTLNSEMVRAQLEAGDFRIDPPQSHIEVYKKLDEAYATFNRDRAQLDYMLELAIGRGDYSPEAQATFMELYGSMDSFVLGKVGKPGVIDRVNYLRKKLDQTDAAISKLNQELGILLETYINEVTPTYFTAHRSTLAQELDNPLSNLLENPGRISEIWKVWMDLWRERPPEQGTSLY